MRVLAGPGTGKTFSLQLRVSRLIHGEGQDATKIFVGTFTRAITADLANALEEQVEQGIEVSTIHSLAYKLIRQHPAARQNRPLRFLLNVETEPMLYDIGVTHSQFGNQRERAQLLRQLIADLVKRDLIEHEFSGEVDRWIRLHGAMLIDQVVPLVTEALKNSDIPAGGFDHVIIDEYQDLTACEQELVEPIWSTNGSLVVLGDDDQSIYSFRYNYPEGMKEFATRHEGDGLLNIEIPDNRRSGKGIVDFANSVIAESGPTKPPLVQRFQHDGDVTRLHWESEGEEIEGLAKMLNSRSQDPFLVLVPRRFIGTRLQEKIGPDAKTSFNQQLLSQPLASERFSLASLIANPNDRVSLRSWLGLKGSESEHAQDWNCEAYASIIDLDFSGSDILNALSDGSVKISGTGKANLLSRAKMFTQIQAQMPADLEEQVMVLFDPNLVTSSTDDESSRWVRHDLETLQTLSLRMIRSVSAANLSAIVDSLRYRIGTNLPIENEADTRVRIMTLHSAKGLQSDNVIIAGGIAKDGASECPAGFAPRVLIIF